MKHRPLKHLLHKYSAVVLMAVIVFLEIRRGYFKDLRFRLRSLSWRPYLVSFASLAVFAVSLLFVDSVILDWIQDRHSFVAKAIVDGGGWVGRSTHCWMVLAGVYVVSYCLRLEKGRRYFFSALLSSFIASTLVVIFKFVFLRARPCSNLGPFSFFHLRGLLQDDNLFQGFPSGDVVVVAGAAGYFFHASKNRYLNWLWLLPPLATAFSRMHLDRHWPSDVFFSLGLGLLIARFVLDFKEIQKNRSDRKIKEDLSVP